IRRLYTEHLAGKPGRKMLIEMTLDLFADADQISATEIFIALENHLGDFTGLGLMVDRISVELGRCEVMC
ncbi:MAG TPA: hypothetical protein PLJ29_09055, partial [Leptospiraceae bacterium]|nr:hypothetical protein [Leptospiraceae bacterium]